MVGNLAILLMLSTLTSTTFAFPMGRCYVRSCSASPYDLKWSSVTFDSRTSQMTACIDLRNKNCTDNSQYNCCGVFGNLLEKFDISSVPACKNSVVQVTVNGNKKGGGIYFDVYDNNGQQEGQLRITGLNTPGPRVQGMRVCITTRAPCNTLSSFCRDIRGNCRYSLFNPDGHTCCPTCSLISLNNSTPSPTPEPTPSPTPSPTPEPTPSPTPSPTPEPTPSPTPEPTPSPTPEPTPSPTPEPTPSPRPDPPFCGDGICNTFENYTSCSIDCPAICGNDICESPEEDDCSCPQDCGNNSECGNGVCEEPYEDSDNCSQDCHPSGPTCGDGSCDPPENNASCPQDCHQTGPTCGNGVCDRPSESMRLCPQDCNPVCGNGVCDLAEDRTRCPADCVRLRSKMFF